MSKDIQEMVLNDIIFKGVLGSQAYGTNTPDSDEDFGGVALLSDKSYYIGNKSFDQLDKFYDADGNKFDQVIYNFVKFIKLASDCNPNIMDYLFIPDKCIRICTPEWEEVMANRDLFVSKKARFTFAGYAYSQLRRIQNHRAYLLNPPKKQPVRSEFGLPDKCIFPDTQYQAILNISWDYVEESRRNDFYNDACQLVDDNMYDLFNRYIDDRFVNVALNNFKVGQTHFLTMLSSIQSKYLKEEYTTQASKELSFMVANKNWKKYKEWEHGRNPNRQKMEAKCGFDSKHAMHLIRLMKMGNEILEGKGVLVDRSQIDRDHLMDIRFGNVKFDDVVAEYEKLEAGLNQKYKDSTLPKTSDRNKINELKMRLIEKRVWQ